MKSSRYAFAAACLGIVLPANAQTVVAPPPGGTATRYVPVTYSYRTLGLATIVAETSPDIAFTCKSQPQQGPGGALSGYLVTCSGTVRTSNLKTGRPTTVSIKLRKIDNPALAGSATSYVSGKQWTGACAGSAGTTCTLQVKFAPAEFGADMTAMP